MYQSKHNYKFSCLRQIFKDFCDFLSLLEYSGLESKVTFILYYFFSVTLATFILQIISWCWGRSFGSTSNHHFHCRKHLETHPYWWWVRAILMRNTMNITLFNEALLGCWSMMLQLLSVSSQIRRKRKEVGAGQMLSV